jgi:hypothetical protein
MSTPSISIRTDVPMPERKRVLPPGRKSLYPFDKLEVNHSFLVAFDELGSTEDNAKLRTRVSRAVTSANKAAKDNGTGKFFQVRVEEAGVGVWRTR